jgi:hypothetical protein
MLPVSTCGSSGVSAAHGTLGLADSPEVRSSMPSLSGKGLQKLKTALFPVIGRAICSAAPKIVTSQPWWNDIRRHLILKRLFAARLEAAKTRAEV